MKTDQIVPSENIKTYCALFEIETALRELIIELLTAKVGPKWYKQRIPQQIFEKSQEGFRNERKACWTQYIFHHPIYYVDFPQLKEIIIRKDNWNDVFHEIFNRQDIFIGMLSELEPIRNKIAHNRKATGTDQKIIEDTLTKLTSIIGKERFVGLSMRCTCLDDLCTQLSSLHSRALESVQLCCQYEPIINTDPWNTISSSWWFDESYIEHSIQAINAFFLKIEEYKTFSRCRGEGFKIEAWVNSIDMQGLFNAMDKEMKEVLSNERK